MPLYVLCYEEFINPNCLNEKVEMSMPCRYLQEPFRKLLMVIRKYFTCERRSNRIQPHHISLLMHFTGRRPLNLPFFLHQILRGMAYNVQDEANQLEKKLSHISLIKLLIVEQLRHLGKSWDSFLLAADIPKDPKGDPPLPMGKETSHSVEVEIGRDAEKGKTLEALPPQQPIPRKRGKPRKNRETERPKPQANYT
jgi:hypothetical protein